MLETGWQNDFPELAKVYSIGKSFEGRDINVIEIDGTGGRESTLLQEEWTDASNDDVEVVEVKAEEGDDKKVQESAKAE